MVDISPVGRSRIFELGTFFRTPQTPGDSSREIFGMVK